MFHRIESLEQLFLSVWLKLLYCQCSSIKVIGQHSPVLVNHFENVVVFAILYVHHLWQTGLFTWGSNTKFDFDFPWKLTAYFVITSYFYWNLILATSVLDRYCLLIYSVYDKLACSQRHLISSSWMRSWQPLIEGYWLKVNNRPSVSVSAGCNIFFTLADSAVLYLIDVS